MSLLDNVHCRHPHINAVLGTDPLITRDLGETMGDFWITPAGELFRFDTTGAFDWDFSGGELFPAIIPTGNPVRLTPFYLTGEVMLYGKPSPIENYSWEKLPQVLAIFLNGKILETIVGTWGDPPVRKFVRL